MGRSNWGDDVDEELQARSEEFKPKFTINFKKMTFYIDRIVEETKEWDDKHPKDDLMKMWAGIMIMMFVLFMCSYNIMLIATVPFFGFYGYVLIQLSRTFKRFGYKRLPYWILTILSLAILFVISYYIKGYIFGQLITVQIWRQDNEKEFSY